MAKARPSIARSVPPGRDQSSLTGRALEIDLGAVSTADTTKGTSPLLQGRPNITDGTTTVKGPKNIAFSDAIVTGVSGVATVVIPRTLPLAIFAGTGGGGPFDFHIPVDLTHFTKARISFQQNTAHASGATITAQYSNDMGGSWIALDGISGPAMPCDVTGKQVSLFVDLDSIAMADVWIRAYDSDNGSFPSPGEINTDDSQAVYVEFRNY